MNNIVIAFPKAETAAGIKKILSQSGYPVTGVCTTGAQALQYMNSLEDGILICGSRFSDMVYEELYEYLPRGFQMLLIASAPSVMEKTVDNLVCLSLPIKIHELLQTVGMMEYSLDRARKNRRRQPRERTKEERQLISRAKELLMERNGFSEEEAHRYIQKRSMDNGTGIVETAEMILSLMGDG